MIILSPVPTEERVSAAHVRPPVLQPDVVDDKGSVGQHLEALGSGLG